MNIREAIVEKYPGVPLLLMEPEDYDKAIIGVVYGKAHHPSIAYDIDKTIEVNVSMGMTYDEALEHFSRNQDDGYHGKHTWTFIRRQDDN